MTVHVPFASWSSPLIRCGPKKPEVESQSSGHPLRSVLRRAGLICAFNDAINALSHNTQLHMSRRQKDQCPFCFVYNSFVTRE
jgi:hypothetical protein